MLVLVVLLPSGLSLSRKPEAAANSPPTAAEVRRSREVYQRVRMAQQAPGEQVLRVSWEELAAVAAMSGRAAGFERVNIAPETDRAHLRVSRELPLGFWLNGHAFIARADDGQPRMSARIGHLPIPAFVVHAAIGAAIKVLRMRGANIQPLEKMVTQVRLDPGGMRAVVDLPVRARVFRTLRALSVEELDGSRIETHYCRLINAQRAEPDALLAGLVRQAFAAGDGTATDNRSIFVALALLVAQIDAGAMPGGKEALFDRCGKSEKEFALQGRADLAKHWTVSAAISSYLGTDTSLTLGTWKEIFDSGKGGSGFSLVDLAADRSGTFAAQRGADPDKAVAMKNWLAQATDSNLLPISALALAEGMTESEFRAQYTNTDSTTYTATVARIDSALEVLMH